MESSSPISTRVFSKSKVSTILLVIVALIVQQSYCVPLSVSVSPNVQNSEKVELGQLQQPRHRNDPEVRAAGGSQPSSSAAAALIMGPLSSMISKMRGMRVMKRRDVTGQQEDRDHDRGRDLIDDENSSSAGGNNADQIIYPMVISKKSATALNKLIYALKTSLDSASLEQGIDAIPSRGFTGLAVAPRPFDLGLSEVREAQATAPRQIYANMNYDPYNPHLQRRGQQKDRKNYLRCYFNAVSCF